MILLSTNLYQLKNMRTRKMYENVFWISTYFVIGYILVSYSIFQDEKKISSNNSLDSAKVVIFNRVPKCGSATMSSLLGRLAKRNGFNLHKSHIHGNEIVKGADLQFFIQWILSILNRGNGQSFIQDTVFVKHQHYVELPDELWNNVIYINLMRDPVKRFISGYYFKRKTFKKHLEAKIITVYPDHLQQLYQVIDNQWLNKNTHVCGEKTLQNYKNDPSQNFECEKHTMYIIKDAKSMQKLNNVSTDWLNKSLNSCVETKSDPECNDFSETRRIKTSLRDSIIKHLVGSSNLLKNDSLMYPPFMYPTAIPYFCGTDKFCPSATSDLAISQAITNIDSRFEVVGVTEKMEMFIRVLEAKLPRFFSGAFEEYQKMVKEGSALKNKNDYDPPTEEMINALKKSLEGEYTVYNHVVKRLQQQYEDIVSQSR